MGVSSERNFCIPVLSMKGGYFVSGLVFIQDRSDRSNDVWGKRNSIRGAVPFLLLGLFDPVSISAKAHQLLFCG